MKIEEKDKETIMSLIETIDRLWFETQDLYKIAYFIGLSRNLNAVLLKRNKEGTSPKLELQISQTEFGYSLTIKENVKSQNSKNPFFVNRLQADQMETIILEHLMQK